jgi:hypothetical protein
MEIIFRYLGDCYYWVAALTRRQVSIAQVFRRDSPGKAAQWMGRFIRESLGVLWLVIRLLSVQADVSSSVTKHSSLYSEVKMF